MKYKPKTIIRITESASYLVEEIIATNPIGLDFEKDNISKERYVILGYNQCEHEGCRGHNRYEMGAYCDDYTHEHGRDEDIIYVIYAIDHPELNTYYNKITGNMEMNFNIEQKSVVLVKKKKNLLRGDLF